jgi:S1-C subfamily serine protease
LTCGLLLLIATTRLANAQTPHDVARKASPSVVLLAMKDENGQPLSLGSGFFVADGVVATNLHVVSGASSGEAKIVGQARTYAISGVVAMDADADLALLKLSASGGCERTPEGIPYYEHIRDCPAF